MNTTEQLTDDNAGKLVLTELPTPQQKQVIVMGLRNEEYKRIAAKARKHGAEGVKLSNKSGEHRFFLEDGKMFAEKCNKDGVKETQEVINIDDLPVEAMNASANRLKLWDSLRAENPDLPDSDIDAYVDIFYEAQRSMTNLIHQGVPANEAKRIVLDALKDEMTEALNDSDKVEVEYVSAK